MNTQQLKKDGTWGEVKSFGFVNAKHVIALCEHLPNDVPVYLTIGLSYRNPTTHVKPFAPRDLAVYVRDTLRDRYWYEVLQRDDRISVTALDDNDLF